MGTTNDSHDVWMTTIINKELTKLINRTHHVVISVVKREQNVSDSNGFTEQTRPPWSRQLQTHLSHRLQVSHARGMAEWGEATLKSGHAEIKIRA